MQEDLVCKLISCARYRAKRNRLNRAQIVRSNANRDEYQWCRQIRGDAVERVNERDESKVHRIKRLAFNRRTIELSEETTNLVDYVLEKESRDRPRTIHRGKLNFSRRITFSEFTTSVKRRPQNTHCFLL